MSIDWGGFVFCLLFTLTSFTNKNEESEEYAEYCAGGGSEWAGAGSCTPVIWGSGGGGKTRGGRGCRELSELETQGSDIARLVKCDSHREHL